MKKLLAILCLALALTFVCGMALADDDVTDYVPVGNTVDLAFAQGLQAGDGVELANHEQVVLTDAKITKYPECGVTGKLRMFFNGENGTTRIQDVNINALAHTPVKVEKQDPTCTVPGWVEYYYCSNEVYDENNELVFKCDKYFLDEDCKNETPWEEIELIKPHTPGELTEAKTPTCFEDGNVAYVICEECGNYFTDETCETAIENNDPVLPKYAHLYEDGTEAWTHYEAVAHDKDHITGNLEYCYCELCGKYFQLSALDENVTEDQAVKYEDLLIGHTFTKTEKAEADCQNDGNIEYYTCDICGLIYTSDEDIFAPAEDAISLEDTVIAKHHTSLQKYPANPATCTEHGNIEFLYCSACDNYFDLQIRMIDKNGPNTVQALKDTFEYYDRVPYALIDPMTGHALGAEQDYVKPTCTTNGKYASWQCSRCGMWFNKFDSYAYDIYSELDPLAMGHWEYRYTDYLAEVNAYGLVQANSDWDRWYGLGNSNVIPKYNHKYDNGQPAAIYHEKATADCITDGYSRDCYECALCGEYFEDANLTWKLQTNPFTPALGHLFDAWVIEKPATCSETGEKFRWCNRENCHFKYWEEIPTLEPDWQEVSEEDFSCFQTIVTAECVNCGKDADPAHKPVKYYKTKDVPTHTEHEADVIAESTPNCVLPGYKVYECTACKNYDATADKYTPTKHVLPSAKVLEKAKEGWLAEGYYVEVIDALGHKYDKTNVPGGWLQRATMGEVDDEGNVVSKNYFVRTCNVCGASEECWTESSRPADGCDHENVDVEITATCTEAGKKITTCLDCGDVTSEDIEALGHDMQEMNTTEVTCTTPGVDVGFYCKRCQKLFADAEGAEEITDDDRVIPAEGHQLVELEGAKEATCLEDGYAAAWQCSVCGQIFLSDDIWSNDAVTEEDRFIPAMGHDYDLDKISDYKPEGFDWSEEDQDWTIVNCLSDGHLHAWYCNRCEKWYWPMNWGDWEPDYFTAEVVGDGTDEALILGAPGHDLQPMEAFEANCTFEGINEGFFYCTKCGQVFYSDEDPFTDDVAADEDLYIPVDVDAHDWSEPIVATEPTCTTPGYSYLQCNINPAHIFPIIVPANGHVMEYVAEAEPTEDADGNYAHYVCTVCGGKFWDEEGKFETTEEDVVWKYTAPLPEAEYDPQIVSAKDGIVAVELNHNPETDTADLWARITLFNENGTYMTTTKRLDNNDSFTFSANGALYLVTVELIGQDTLDAEYEGVLGVTYYFF